MNAVTTSLTTAADSNATRTVATRQLAGVWVPDTPVIARAIEYKEAEVSLCTSGIGLDWGGWGYDSLPKNQAAEIVDALPRLEMKERFTRDVCRIVMSRPATTYDNVARDFGERFVPGYQRPSAVDLLLGSPFTEQGSQP